MSDVAPDSAVETRLSRVRSSLTQPIEACGHDGERAWLIAATCADGSHPIRSQQEARKLFEGSKRTSAPGSVDLYRVPCPEGSYDVYMAYTSCEPGKLGTVGRRDCFVVADDEQPGMGIDCLGGQKRKLDPDDPECLQLLLTSPQARAACQIGARIMSAAGGGYLHQRCGPIWGVDGGVAWDGPYYYYDERTMRRVAVCDGSCSGKNCKNCKKVPCGPGPREQAWQSLYRFYEAEFLASPPLPPTPDR